MWRDACGIVAQVGTLLHLFIDRQGQYLSALTATFNQAIFFFYNFNRIAILRLSRSISMAPVNPPNCQLQNPGGHSHGRLLTLIDQSAPFHRKASNLFPVIV